MNRHDLMKIAMETVALGDKESKELLDAVENTVSYPNDCELPEMLRRKFVNSKCIVKNAVTLEVAKALIDHELNPVALNFASATRPGGGFLKGTEAQEEYLARNSFLYHCIKDNPMYAFHKEMGDKLYTDYMIYSPDVPVVRDEYSNLLEKPYPCSIITAAAVNKTSLRGGVAENVILAEMEKRIDKVLTIAAHHRHDSLVLGAWGCGVFGNDPEAIAKLFKTALDGKFKDTFKCVAFAVLDRSFSGHVFNTFREILG